MRKSTLLKVLAAVTVAVVLLVSARAFVTANSYVDCASRIIRNAPLTDASPPASFRRMAVILWGHRDLFLARTLAQECPAGARGGLRRELIALGTVKTMLDPAERVTLGAVLFRMPEGRGLTYAAQTEWGRPPAALNDLEMIWLFTIGQWPHCSKHRVIPEAERKECEDLYKSLLARASASPQAP